MDTRILIFFIIVSVAANFYFLAYADRLLDINENLRVMNHWLEKELRGVENDKSNCAGKSD